MSDDVLTLTTQQAADYVTNGSLKTFRQQFVKTGRIKSFDFGTRGQLFLKDDVRAAALKIVAEQRANPELAKLRNGGAVLAAQGRVVNPYGRKGKPKPAAAVKKGK